MASAAKPTSSKVTLQCFFEGPHYEEVSKQRIGGFQLLARDLQSRIVVHIPQKNNALGKMQLPFYVQKMGETQYQRNGKGNFHLIETTPLSIRLDVTKVYGLTLSIEKFTPDLDPAKEKLFLREQAMVKVEVPENLKQDGTYDLVLSKNQARIVLHEEPAAESGIPIEFLEELRQVVERMQHIWVSEIVQFLMDEMYLRLVDLSVNFSQETKESIQAEAIFLIYDLISKNPKPIRLILDYNRTCYLQKREHSLEEEFRIMYESLGEETRKEVILQALQESEDIKKMPPDLKKRLEKIASEVASKPYTHHNLR